MRIRTKLAISQAVLVLGFLSSFVIVSFLSIVTARQHNFQMQTLKVMASMDQIKLETQLLIIDKGVLLEYRIDRTLSADEDLNQTRWVRSYNDLQSNLEVLVKMSADDSLTLNLVDDIQPILGKWNQIHEAYYQPALKHLISFTGSSPGIVRDETKRILMPYLDRLFEETSIFSSDILNLSISIQEYIDRNILISRRLGLFFIFVTLGIVIFTTINFSRLIVRRIHRVGDAMKQVSTGNFSFDLIIKSGDEFEELAADYKTLKEQLQIKLNSVLNFLVSISTKPEDIPNLSNILSIITSSVMDNTKACGSGIYLVDSDEETLMPQAFTGLYLPPFPVPPEMSTSKENALAYAREKRILIGEYSIGTSVRNIQPTFIRSVSALDEKECDFTRSQDDPLCISSLIIAPLTIAQRILGVIVIIKRPSAGFFTDLDFTHVQTFADYAALTIDNFYNTEELIEKREMHRDITIASDIQQRLLPKNMPSLKTAQISAFSRAARGISGDYYDAFFVGEGKMSVVICDVVGKGVPASLLMVMIRTIIRLAANPSRSPGQLLDFLNKGVVRRIGTDQFATLSIFSYDENSRTVTYANAAHLPLLLYQSKKQSFLEIDTPGLPIGVEQKERYVEKNFPVESGDLLILFTDGISEARSSGGQEYTNTGLMNQIQLCSQKMADDIVNTIREDLDKFVGEFEQHDDQTLIVLKVNP